MSPDPLLRVRNVEVVYNDVILVLRGVSLEVPSGSIVKFWYARGKAMPAVLRHAGVG